MNAGALVKFNFHGDELDVVPGPGEAHVVIRRVCEALGVDFAGQLRSLKSDPAATVEFKSMVGSDGKRRRIACLDLRSLPLWLAGIHPNKVKPAARPKLIRYKRECADVLADHFLGKRGDSGAMSARLEALEARFDTFDNIAERRHHALLEHVGAEVRVTVHAAVRPLATMVTGLALRMQLEHGSGQAPLDAPVPKRRDGRSVRASDVAAIMRAQQGMWLWREIQLLATMIDLADEDSDEIKRFSLPKLVRESKLPRTTLYRALDVLVAAGVVVRTSRQRGNSYRLDLDALLKWNGQTRPKSWITRAETSRGVT